jgi:glycine hydroxymethyltransferase
MNSLYKKDREISDLIKKELQRQKYELNMIPSENYASKSVLEASGSILMNKYSEGYPKKRYYQGNRFIDDIEQLAIDRAKELFNAEHANVQPHSGSPANIAAYFALLKPGSKIMGMDLSHGGHLTHGNNINISGRLYHFVSYGVDKETGLLDMDKVRRIAEQEQPHMIISGFTAYPRKIDFKEFHDIAQSVNAISMADISHIAGLVAAGAHPSPLPYTDIVTSTTHKTLRGPRGAIILCKEIYAGSIDKAVFPGVQGGPHEHTIAAKAVCFKEALHPDFKEYGNQTVRNAQTLADRLMSKDIKLVSGGTDTHLILIDLIQTASVAQPGKGKHAALALEAAGIITNANTIPYEPSTPLKPSGLRLGTPILTTRGMKEQEMQEIGTWIADIINNLDDKELQKSVKKKVRELCRQFQYY